MHDVSQPLSADMQTATECPMQPRLSLGGTGRHRWLEGGLCLLGWAGVQMGRLSAAQRDRLSAVQRDRLFAVQRGRLFAVQMGRLFAAQRDRLSAI